jgi:hypothetical protein
LLFFRDEIPHTGLESLGTILETGFMSQVVEFP